MTETGDINAAKEKFYEQTVITGDIPLDTEADYLRSVDMSRMTAEEFKRAFAESLKSTEKGDVYTVEEVFGEYD